MHVVGPQGAGKSLLATLIVRGAQADGREAGYVCAEEAMDLSNAQIRARFPQCSMVLVEANHLQQRHSDLAPGDWVITVARGGAAARRSTH